MFGVLKTTLLGFLLALTSVAQGGSIVPIIEDLTSSYSMTHERGRPLSEVVQNPNALPWQTYPDLIKTPEGDVFTRHVLKVSPVAQSSHLMFNLTQLFLEESEWIMVDSHGMIRATAKMGAGIPIGEWTHVQNLSGIQFDVHPGETLTLFGRYFHRANILADFTIGDPDNILEENATAMALFWIFLGTTIAIVVYNSAMFFTTGEIVYPVYVFFLLNLVVVDAGVWGVSQPLYATYFPKLNILNYITVWIGQTAAILMMLTYLGKNSISKRTRIFGLSLAVISACDSIFYILAPPIANGFTPILNFMMIAGIVALVTSAVKRKHFFALFVLFAMLGPAVAIITWSIAKSRGVMFPLRQVVTIGFLWEAIVMTIGLSQRIHALRRKLLHTLSKQKEILETEVATRTTDITEKAKIIAAQQLEISAAARAKSIAEVAVGVSHEINNPLTILQGHLSMARRLLDKPNSTLEDKMKHIDLAFATTDRIAGIVRSLRALTLEEEHANGVSCSLLEAVESTTATFNEQCRKSDILLRTKGFDTRDKVAIQQMDLNEVLQSLVANGIFAVKDLGQDQRWIRITYESLRDFACIRIIDGGRGIDPETAQRMFDPFFTTKSPQIAKGLGLALALATVNRCHGKLRYVATESNTTFEILLPLIKKSDQHPKSA